MVLPATGAFPQTTHLNDIVVSSVQILKIGFIYIPYSNQKCKLRTHQFNTLKALAPTGQSCSRGWESALSTIFWGISRGSTKTAGIPQRSPRSSRDIKRLFWGKLKQA